MSPRLTRAEMDARIAERDAAREAAEARRRWVAADRREEFHRTRGDHTEQEGTMTDADVKAASEAMLRAMQQYIQDPADILVVLGTGISAVARSTADPVKTARMMIDGLEGWIRLYQAEQRTGGAR